MKFIKKLIPYIIIITVVVLVRTFFVTPVKVNGSSMAPTLRGGEIMILNKRSKIKRFDIVVLKIDEQPDNLIKRVIGMPGEEIEIRSETIYINDKPIEDNYGAGHTYDIDKIKLKDDEYYVLGDNRQISMDSRIFGPVKREDIKGTTKYIVYPFNKFGKVEK